MLWRGRGWLLLLGCPVALAPATWLLLLLLLLLVGVGWWPLRGLGPLLGLEPNGVAPAAAAADRLCCQLAAS
jgi:hypothetical protein